MITKSVRTWLLFGATIGTAALCAAVLSAGNDAGSAPAGHRGSTSVRSSGTAARSGAAATRSEPGAGAARSRPGGSAAVRAGADRGLPTRPGAAANGPAITGTFTLWAATPLADPCAAKTAAPDIRNGAPVTIRSAAGARVASTILTAGRSEATHRGCVYRFAVTPLPADLSFSVTVGTRAGLVYTPAQLAASDGHLTLNLGLPA